MRRAAYIVVAICAMTMLAAPWLVGRSRADEGGVRVTVGKPATVPLSEAAERSSAAAGGGRIVVTVTGFEPSPAGPVTTVVSVRCGEGLREIGRFGVFPHTAFTASAKIAPQRFGFDLPDDPTCRRPEDVMIGLEPAAGDGAGASITIGNASLE